MSKKPDGPERDPMAGEVEKLLRQLRPPEERSRPGHSPAPGGSRAGPARRPPGTAPPPPITVTLPSPGGVWARAALGAVLVGAMTQWPYPTCGLPLIGYFAAVAVVLVGGVWAGYAAWRRRMAAAHVLAVAVIFAGLALTAHQVLPRVGYAPAPVGWACKAQPGSTNGV